MPRVLLALLLLPMLAVAAPVPKALKKQPRTTLTGTWRVVEVSVDGEPLQKAGSLWVIDDKVGGKDQVTPTFFDLFRYMGGEDAVYVERLSEGMLKKPTPPGLHESRGATLKVCLATTAGGACTPDKGRVLYVLELVTDE